MAHQVARILLFPGFWQDRLAARTTAVIFGTPNGGIWPFFPSIWTHSSCRLLLNA
jgi:hypothetical protein